MEKLKFIFLTLGAVIFILSGCNVDTNDSEIQLKKECGIN